MVVGYGISLLDQECDSGSDASFELGCEVIKYHECIFPRACLFLVTRVKFKFCAEVFSGNV